MGPDKRLVEFIKNKYGIQNFIETGTYYGGTTEWASTLFKDVHSIELSEYWYNHTRNRLIDRKNIKLYFGDTREFLPKILSVVDSAILWLDAHWCADNSSGEDDQCPLMQELEIINEHTKNFFILIDDARLFLAPPPEPNHIKFYPDLLSLIDILRLKNRHVYVYNDIIIAIPIIAKDEFDLFLQGLASQNQLSPLKSTLYHRIKNKLTKLK